MSIGTMNEAIVDLHIIPVPHFSGTRQYFFVDFERDEDRSCEKLAPIRSS